MLSDALRRITKGTRLSSLEVPVLDEAADEIDRLVAEVRDLREALALYDAAADKFIAKVETRRAFSRETYAELKAARAASREGGRDAE